MLCIRDIENMKALDGVKKKQWIRGLFRRKHKQHLVINWIGDREEERPAVSSEVSDVASDPALASHTSLISPSPVSYAGVAEKKPMGWLNG